MARLTRFTALGLTVALVLLGSGLGDVRLKATQSSSATYAPDLFGEMRWRSIGPFRGGRTKAAAGIPSQPNVFYIGVVNGGIWKTTD